MSTRDKYLRVRGQEPTNEQKLDTDILLKTSQSYGKYISRSLTLLFGEDKPFVTLKAAQRLIERALWVSEIVRRKVPDLHQIITISQKKIIEVYMPKEEGLLKVEKQSFLTIVEVVLTRTPTAQQKKSPGYEGPIQGDLKEVLTKEKWQEREKEFAEKRNQRESNGGDNKRQRPERTGERENRGQQRQRGRGERR